MSTLVTGTWTQGHCRRSPRVSGAPCLCGRDGDRRLPRVVFRTTGVARTSPEDPLHRKSGLRRSWTRPKVSPWTRERTRGRWGKDHVRGAPRQERVEGRGVGENHADGKEGLGPGWKGPRRLSPTRHQTFEGPESPQSFQREGGRPRPRGSPTSEDWGLKKDRSSSSTPETTRHYESLRVSLCLLSVCSTFHSLFFPTFPFSPLLSLSLFPPSPCLYLSLPMGVVAPWSPSVRVGGCGGGGGTVE